MARLDLTKAYRKQCYLLTTVGKAYGGYGPAESVPLVVEPEPDGKTFRLEEYNHWRLSKAFNDKASAFDYLNAISAGGIRIRPGDVLNGNIGHDAFKAELFQVEIIPVALSPKERALVPVLGALSSLSYEAEDKVTKLASKLDPAIAKTTFEYEAAPWLTEGGHPPLLGCDRFITMNGKTRDRIAAGDLSLQDVGTLLKDNDSYRCDLKGVAKGVGKTILKNPDPATAAKVDIRIAAFRLYSVHAVAPERIEPKAEPEAYVLQDRLREALANQDPRAASVIRQHLKL